DGDEPTSVTVRFDGRTVAPSDSASGGANGDRADGASGGNGDGQGDGGEAAASSTPDGSATSKHAGGSQRSNASQLPTTGGPDLGNMLAGLMALLAGVIIVERSRRFGRG